MDEAKTLTAFYDLRSAPYHFDFIFVAVMADAVRRDRDCDALELVIVPDQGSSLNCTDHRHSDQFSADQANWRVANIFMPAATLLPHCTGLTVCASRQQARSILARAKGPIFPDDYNVEHPPERYWTNDEFSMLANLGIEIPGLFAPQQSLEYVDHWIETHVGDRKIVSITLRESGHDIGKNSDLPVWAKFASRLDQEVYCPVFLPDLSQVFAGPRDELAPFLTINEAVTNLILRCAFYERCYVTMMVTQGPSTLCYMNGGIRYIIVKSTPPEFSNSFPPYPIAMGLNVNEPWPHATRFHRRLEEAESLELLESEFHRMVGLIEADPADAFSRQTMRRADAGPENIARLSGLFGLLPFMSRSVAVCQMYLDRHPDDLDVLKTMACADLRVQHQNQKILARSRDLYLKALNENVDIDQFQFALAKVEVVLGDSSKLDWLVDRADAIQELIDENGIVSTDNTEKVDFLLSLASLCARMDKPAEALHVSKAAARMDPTVDRITNLAVMLEATGNFEEARDLLTQLVDQGVISALICEALGRIYKSLGEPALAIDFIQKGVEMSSIESGTS